MDHWGPEGAYVIVWSPVSKLRSEDILQVTTAPPLLAMSVISVVVGRDTAKSTFEVVRCWPWIARGNADSGRLFEGLGFNFDIDESHDGWRGQRKFSSPEQICCYTWRGSQEEKRATCGSKVQRNDVVAGKVWNEKK